MRRAPEPQQKWREKIQKCHWLVAAVIYITAVRAGRESGVGRSQRGQRAEEGGAGVDGDLAGLGRGRNAVGEDVQHLVVAHARRLELPRVARVVHAVLVPAARQARVSAGGARRQLAAAE